MLSVIVFSFLIASSWAQMPGTGPCAPIKGTPNFDASKVHGVWYGYEAYPNCGSLSSCRYIQVSDDKNGGMVIVESVLEPGQSRLYQYPIMSKYIGDATFMVNNMQEKQVKNVTVTKVEYDSFLIEKSCVDVGQSSLNFAWVLTRSANPSPAVVAKINEALMGQGISKDYLMKYDQNNCPARS